MKHFNLKFVWVIFLLTVPMLAEWKISGEPQRVAGGGEQQFMRPLWSPDGQWLAFSESGYRGIWVLRMATGELRQVTAEPGSGFGFRWARQRNAIAARISRYQGYKALNEVMIFDIENGAARVVSGEPIRLRGLPQWSPDDREIVILAKNEMQRFPSGMALAESPGAVAPPVYLKNGKIVIEGSGRQIAKVIDPPNGRRYINLSVSPDGQKIAVEEVGGSLWVMPIDGSAPVDLGVGYRASWAPDSRHLVYMISEDDGHTYVASDLYVIAIDGSGKTNLTRTPGRIEMNPAWAPDGVRIAYDVYEEGAIYVAELRQQ